VAAILAEAMCPLGFTHGTRHTRTYNGSTPWVSELGQMSPASTLRRLRRLMQPATVRRPAIRTEIRGGRVASNRAIEHPAQPHVIHDTAMHAEAHDATRALVHRDEHAM
jgi:hypothetical protein